MEIRAAVTARLTVLGYTVADDDGIAIDYSITRAEERIKVQTNQTEVPGGLTCVWVDMAAGMFLADKKAAGQLGESFDFTAPAQKITEGDVSVEFAGADNGSTTPEARFDALINRLIDPPAYVFARYRRLVW